MIGVALAGCKVDLAVSVESNELGAGRVRVEAELDRAAAASLSPGASGAASRLKVDDLRKVGWQGPGLALRADGSGTFSLSHRFGTVDEANELLAQISSADGPFGRLELRRSRGPISTTVTLRGPGDFTKGLSSFGDATVARVTGAGAFGVSDAQVLRQAGAKDLASILRVRVDSNLIGTKHSTELAPGKATPISASATSWSWATIAAFAAALVALIAFVALRHHERTAAG